MALKIIWNTILDERADAIVTPASRRPRVGTGLDKAVHEAAGPLLLRERRKLGVIEPGVVKVTDSFRLADARCRAKHVIHALGPWCESGLNGTERPILIGCYLQILCTAVSIGCKTVAVPVISSGKFGMPMAMAVDTAVEAIELFLKAVPELEVKLVGIDRDFYDYAKENYPGLAEARIDETAEKAYRLTHSRRRWEDGPACGEAFDDREESAYFRNLRFHRETDGKTFNQLLIGFWEDVKARDTQKWKSIDRKYRPAKEKGDYLLTQANLAERSTVSARNVRRYLSASDHTVPARDTVILLATALQLPFDYLKVLLQRCRYPVDGPELPKRDRLILDVYRTKPARADIDLALAAKGFAPMVKN